MAKKSSALYDKRKLSPQSHNFPSGHTEKSVTGLYYSFDSFGFKNKNSDPNIFKNVTKFFKQSYNGIVPIAVKLYKNTGSLGLKRCKFFREDTVKNDTIKPWPIKNGDRNNRQDKTENPPYAMVVQLPKETLHSKDFSITLELETLKSNTSINNEDVINIINCKNTTNSQAVFSGVVTLPSDSDVRDLHNLPLYLVDSKENIINPGSKISHKTLIKPQKIKNTSSRGKLFIEIGRKLDKSKIESQLTDVCANHQRAHTKSPLGVDKPSEKKMSKNKRTYNKIPENFECLKIIKNAQISSYTEKCPSVSKNNNYRVYPIKTNTKKNKIYTTSDMYTLSSQAYEKEINEKSLVYKLNPRSLNENKTKSTNNESYQSPHESNEKLHKFFTFGRSSDSVNLESKVSSISSKPSDADISTPSKLEVYRLSSKESQVLNNNRAEFFRHPPENISHESTRKASKIQKKHFLAGICSNPYRRINKTAKQRQSNNSDREKIEAKCMSKEPHSRYHEHLDDRRSTYSISSHKPPSPLSSLRPISSLTKIKNRDTDFKSDKTRKCRCTYKNCSTPGCARTSDNIPTSVKAKYSRSNNSLKSTKRRKSSHASMAHSKINFCHLFYKQTSNSSFDTLSEKELKLSSGDRINKPARVSKSDTCLERRSQDSVVFKKKSKYNLLNRPTSKEKSLRHYKNQTCKSCLDKKDKPLKLHEATQTNKPHCVGNWPQISLGCDDIELLSKPASLNLENHSLFSKYPLSSSMQPSECICEQCCSYSCGSYNQVALPYLKDVLTNSTRHNDHHRCRHWSPNNGKKNYSSRLPIRNSRSRRICNQKPKGENSNFFRSRSAFHTKTERSDNTSLLVITRGTQYSNETFRSIEEIDMRPTKSCAFTDQQISTKRERFNRLSQRVSSTSTLSIDGVIDVTCSETELNSKTTANTSSDKYILSNQQYELMNLLLQDFTFSKESSTDENDSNRTLRLLEHVGSKLRQLAENESFSCSVIEVLHEMLRSNLASQNGQVESRSARRSCVAHQSNYCIEVSRQKTVAGQKKTTSKFRKIISKIKFFKLKKRKKKPKLVQKDARSADAHITINLAAPKIVAFINADMEERKLPSSDCQEENVATKLTEEIESLQNVYADMCHTMELIFNRSLDELVDPSSEENEKFHELPKSVCTIEEDLSDTFLNLKRCLSTVDEILTITGDDVYQLPTSNEEIALHDVKILDEEKNHSKEIEETYNTVENDIKLTIEELMKNTNEDLKTNNLNKPPKKESIKTSVLFDYIDFFEESDPLVIYKHIVDSLVKKSGNQSITVHEDMVSNEQKSKQYGVSRSHDSRLTTFYSKKNNSVPYFCKTHTQQKIPKTSFSFGQAPIQYLPMEWTNITSNLNTGDTSKKNPTEDTSLIEEIHHRIMRGGDTRSDDNKMLEGNILEIFSVGKRGDNSTVVSSEGLRGGASNWSSEEKESLNEVECKLSNAAVNSFSSMVDSRSMGISKCQKFMGVPHVSAHSLPTTSSPHVFQPLGSTNEESVEDVIFPVTSDIAPTSEELVSSLDWKNLVEEKRRYLPRMVEASQLTVSTSEEEYLNKCSRQERKYHCKRMKKKGDFKLSLKNSRKGLLQDRLAQTEESHKFVNDHSQDSMHVCTSKIGIQNSRENLSYERLPKLGRFSSVTFDNVSSDSSGNEYHETDADSRQISEHLFKHTFKSKLQLNTPDEIAFIENNVRENDNLSRKNIVIIDKLSDSQADSF